MQERLTRAEVPIEQTWNLEDLYPTLAAWEAELVAIHAAIPTITAFKGRFDQGPRVVLDCVNAMEAVLERMTRAGTYAGLRAAEDGTSPTNQGVEMKAQALWSKLLGSISFVKSELLALPDGTLERYVATDPDLASLGSFLEEILEGKPYKLAPETEELLASLGDVLEAPYLTYSRAKLTDMEFQPIKDKNSQEYPMSFAMYEDEYETAPDKILRRNAWDSFGAGLKRYQNTLASTFATEITKHVTLAKARKFPSATHMHLLPHRVSVDVYSNLLDIIQTELSPIMQRYARLRKRVLGLDTMLYPEIEVALDPGYSPKISFADASDLILDALSVMGPEYTKIMRTALKERWCDLADNVGKATGAFCASPYGSHSYILITWTDSMRGAFVMAHELGHAGHFQLANKYQRLLNTEVSMFFVEAPSTINELLLGQHILAKSQDKRMRRWVAMQFLATYHHNFVRHLLEAEMQRRVYTLAEQGEPITAQLLSEQKGDLLSRFWGETVEIDETARLTWMRQPHYYMGLYPYTYSAGLTAATTVSQLIRTEGQPAVDRWLRVLKAGGSMKPHDLLQVAGVDMSKPDPIRTAVAYVSSLVDEVETSFAE